MTLESLASGLLVLLDGIGLMGVGVGGLGGLGCIDFSVVLVLVCTFRDGLVAGFIDSLANDILSVLLGKKCDSGTQRGDRRFKVVIILRVASWHWSSLLCWYLASATSIIKF